MECEKRFANPISDRLLMFRIYKGFLQLSKQNSTQKWTNNFKYFFREDIQMISKHMKRCSTSLSMRHYLTHVRMAIIRICGKQQQSELAAEEDPSVIVSLQTLQSQQLFAHQTIFTGARGSQVREHTAPL